MKSSKIPAAPGCSTLLDQAVLPAQYSKIFYAQIPRQDIARYRFLLEGYDNLAIMSVIDRFRAVVRIRFLPDAEPLLRQLFTSQGAIIIESFYFILADEHIAN